MNRIRISEEALHDLNQGFLFYEAQEPGLGDYFVSSLRADIERLKIAAGAHRLVFRDYHRLISKTFPFGIYYTFTQAQQVATVWAVVDLRQHPESIQERLTG